MAEDKIGPEDLLVMELVDVVEGRPPRTEAYKKSYGGAAYLNGTGSGNWEPVARAVEFGATQGEAQKPAREALLKTIFPLMRSRFMITETMSLIYGSMHLAAFASIARTALAQNDQEVASEALACIRLYLSIAAARQLPDGRVLVAGMRSAGHEAWEYGDPWASFALDLALQRDTSRSFAALKKAGKGPKNAWQKAVFTGCQSALVQAMKGWQEDSPLPSGFQATTPLHVLKTSEGVATWIEQNHNSNTKPEICSVWTGGEVTTLPGPRLAALHGKRTNRGWIEASCRREDDKLVVVIDGETFSVPLPGGDVRLSLRISAAGEIEESPNRPDGPDPEGPDPGDPDPETPDPEVPDPEVPDPEPDGSTIDVEALAAEVEALGAQPPETAAAVALVRGRQWQEASQVVFNLMVPKRNQGARVALSNRLAAMAVSFR
ncbi:MAG TPA: hypothetical protein VN851_13960 [Thermoanaerobaculia bacterium]|nr:hypothetical protein [Thermoanaerobaculia bacterium]